jgi:Ribonuclease G/E
MRIIFLLYMEINHKRAGSKNIKKRKERKRGREIIKEVEDGQHFAPAGLFELLSAS